jgi:hypothetical protein
LYENSTSSALKSRVGVNFAVLWNLTPGPQLERVREAVGCGAEALGERRDHVGRAISNSTSRLYIGTETASKVVPVV